MITYYYNYLKYKKKELKSVRHGIQHKYLVGGNNKKIDSIITNTEGVSERDVVIQNISSKLKIYEDKINDLMDKISIVSDSVHIPDGIGETDINPILDNLDSINNKIINLLNEHTIQPLDQKGKISADPMVKSDSKGWADILILYKLIVSNFNEVKKTAGALPLHTVYSKIEGHIDKHIDLINNLVSLLVSYEKMLKEKKADLFNIVKFTLNDSDISLMESEVYNYTTRIDYSAELQYAIGTNYEILSNMTNNIIKTYYKDNKTLTDLKHDAFASVNDIRKGYMVGGEQPQQVELQITNLNQIKDKLMELTQTQDILNKTMESVHNIRNEYYQYRARYNYYVLYLITTMKKHKMLQEQLIYKFINKGIVQFYLSIINNILNKITNKTDSDIINYFSVYHYFTLMKCKNTCDFIVKTIKTEDVIDVFNSSPEFIMNFSVLNNFKDILESYHEIFQNKVTIYSRINDWTNKTLLSDKSAKLFISDDTEATKMIVNQQICSDAKSDMSVNFSEVFDTEKFKSNSIISKYMSLETQISKGKGIMLITYGYSGVGKTVTLFGHQHIQGMLQSTLNNIRDMDKVYLRIYELYGMGTEYSDYWNKDKIYEYLYYYTINIKKGMFKITDVTETPDINTYVDGKDLSTYLEIDKEIVEQVFRNFSVLIGELDDIRKENKRIWVTPNNPESSRSIIIYDMIVKVGEKYVPFVIIDLPGREEIIQSYVTTFLNKEHIKSLNLDTSFNRTLLASLALNPLATALLVPSLIYETVNEQDYATREKLLMTPITDEQGKESVLYNEYLSQRIGSDGNVKGTNTLGDIISFGKKWRNEYKNESDKYMFPLVQNENTKNHPGSSQTLLQIDVDSNLDSSKQVSKHINTIQYQCVGAIYIMNRIIKMDRFDILEKIARKAIDKYFNDYIKKYVDKLDTKDKKINFLKKYLSIDVINKMTDTQIDKKLNDLAYYHNYISPYEGVYINENIIGLIKYLSAELLEKEDSVIQNTIAPKQSTDLIFTNQKQIIRQWNFELYNSIGKTNEAYENIFMINSVLEDMFNTIEKQYISDKIYRYDEPSIESVFRHYKTPLNSAAPIDDYKMFYLFSNEMLELKCVNQLKLLLNTISFIKAIEN